MKTITIKLERKNGSYISLELLKENGKFCWRIKRGSKLETYVKKNGALKEFRRQISIRTFPINRFPHWINRISWNLTLLKLKITNKLYLRCDGCGEGISVWKIRDPNNGRKWFNCCDNCVSFYDLHLSRRKIVKWILNRKQQMKAISKRRNNK